MIFNNKYERLKYDLETKGEGQMKCFGNSMLPILPNASLCFYIKQNTYEIGDIVCCKVNGRWIDAHKITKKAQDGSYLISNNHGFDNGWTKQIYGKVIKSIDKSGIVRKF